MNFADKHLFGYWSGSLFAQDEMQVMEHPALGSLQLYLTTNMNRRKGLDALTKDGSDPTPCLVQNVPRVCAIDTAGIYGNSFATASSARVLAQVTLENNFFFSECVPYRCSMHVRHLCVLICVQITLQLHH